MAARFPSGRPRIYDIPPTNAPFPYITLPDLHDLAVPAECFDSGDVTANVHVWSRTSPPSTIEAKRIAGAVMTDLLAPGALDTMPSNAVGTVRPIDIQSLLEPDGQTAHAVVRLEISLDAI